MAQRVRRSHRGPWPFVRQSTPHSGGTLRESPTLFVHIIHDLPEKVNSIWKILEIILILFYQ